MKPENSKQSTEYRRVDFGNWLFAGLLVCYFLPILIVDVVPTQDGPAHMDTAGILATYQHPDRSRVRDIFEIRSGVHSNRVSQLLMTVWMTCLPVDWAEKFVIGLYLILFPISVRYVIRRIRPENDILSIAAFPLVYNYSLNMGFYNFVLSLPLLLFLLGYCLSCRSQLRTRDVIVVGMLATALYACHIMSFVMAVIALATFVVQRIVDVRGSSPSDVCVASRIPRSLIVILAATAVPLYICLLYAGAEHTAIICDTLGRRIPYLVVNTALVSFSPLEIITAAATSGLVWGAVIQQSCTNPWVSIRNRWTPVALSFLAIYLLAPDQFFGGSMINPRLALFVILVSILWLADQPIARSMKRILMCSGCGLSVLSLLLTATNYNRLNAQLRDIASVSESFDGTGTLVSLVFSPHGVGTTGERLSLRVKPFLHAGGRLAARCGLTNLRNYQANTDHFPIRYRTGFSPYRHMGLLDGVVPHNGLESVPPLVDLGRYRMATQCDVDYVLVVLLTPEQERLKPVQKLFRHLQAEYVLVDVSPAGAARLYRRLRQDR